MKCTRCGKEFDGRFCPECGAPAAQATQQQPSSPVVVSNAIPEKPKMSKLGIAALVLCIIGCTFWIGIVLAIIDLIRKDGSKKTCSIIAIVVSAFWILMSVVFSSTLKNDSGASKQNVNQEQETETEIETNEEAEQKINEEASSEENESSSDAEENSETVYQIGDSASLKDWTINVTGAQIVDSISSGYGSFTPKEEGNKFMQVFVTVNNEGKQADSFLPTINTGQVSAKILYADGYEFSSTNLLGYSNELHDSIINPLSSRTGEIAFEIPGTVAESEDELLIEFSLGNDIIKFKVR